MRMKIIPDSLCFRWRSLTLFDSSAVQILSRQPIDGKPISPSPFVARVTYSPPLGGFKKRFLGDNVPQKFVSLKN